MRLSSGFIRFFLWGFLSFPTWLWADPPPAEPSGNTITVESAANSLPARIGMALPEVEVTTHRLQVPVSQVASSLTVITAKDIEQKQAGTVLEAIQNVPGLDLVQSGGPGEISSAFIRGGNAEHTLVLMDGIPLNDPDSTTREYDDFDQIAAGGVNQIEVVRGPESTLYGSNAMGGVINLITRKGQGPPSGSLLFEGGSYGTFHEAASAQGGNDAGRFSLTASRFDTSGFPSADKSFGNTVNNGDQNTNVLLEVGSSPVSNLKSNILMSYIQSHTSLDDFGGPGGDNPNFFVDGRQLVAGSQTSLKLFNGDWEQVLGISFIDHNRVFTNNPSAYQPFDYERGYYDGQMGQVYWQNNLRLAKEETLVVGFQGQQEWANSSDDFGLGPAVQISSAGIGSGFIESLTSVNDRLFLTLAGRVDDHSEFGIHGTWQAAAAYFIPGTETKLKATYGTGFKAPSLYQLYALTYGNPALQPEISAGFDAGFEQPFGDKLFTLGATYFHNDFTNLIDFDFITNQYYNVTQAQVDGVESFVDFKGIQNLDAKISYTYCGTQNLLTGLPLLRRPQDKAGADIFYRFGPAELGTSLVYVGTRSDVSFLNGVESTIIMPSYFVLNLLGSYSLNANIKIFARVDNLLDQSYEEIWGYGTPGLSIYGGTKISF